MKQNQGRVLPALLGAVLIWGGTYPSLKHVQQSIPPTGLASLRTLIGALLLVSILLARGQRSQFTSREWAWLALLGLIGCTTFQLLLVWGIRWTTPAHSALMGNVSPIFTLLLASLWLGERLSWTRVGGVALSMTGVTMIVKARPGWDFDPATLFGDILTLGSSLAWALYTVLGKPMLSRHPPLAVTAMPIAIGTLALLPFGVTDLLIVEWSALSLPTWLTLIFVSLGSGTASLFWYFALARAEASRVAVFSQLSAVVAMILSISLGQERLTLPLGVGAGTVIAGVLLTRPA